MNVAVNAVESFKRARLIDSVTSDDEKLAAIYKLDEVSELLRSSPADVVREVVEYLVKNRLEHRSPFVKQKVDFPFKFSVNFPPFCSLTALTVFPI